MLSVAITTRWFLSKSKPVVAKISAGPSKRLIEKNESAFLVVPWPGYGCWIIPISSFDSTLLKSSSRTTPNRASN